jgi:hypothetical protein
MAKRASEAIQFPTEHQIELSALGCNRYSGGSHFSNLQFELWSGLPGSCRYAVARFFYRFGLRPLPLRECSFFAFLSRSTSFTDQNRFATAPSSVGAGGVTLPSLIQACKVARVMPNLECFGPSGEPTPSWHCAAPISTASLRIIGKSVDWRGRLNIHFYVVRPRHFTECSIFCKNLELVCIFRFFHGSFVRETGTPSDRL